MGFISWLRSLIHPAASATVQPSQAQRGAAIPETHGGTDRLLTQGHWAAALQTERRLQLLKDESVRYFQLRGERAIVNDGTLQVPPNKAHGLENLAKTCATSEESDWRGLIAAHFDQLQRAQAASPFGATYESVRDRLVIRMWDKDLSSLGDLGPVSREDIPGLKSVLAVDLSETVATVGRSTVAEWGVSESELFTLALTNTKEHALRELEVERDAESGLELIQGDSMYVSSLLLALQTLPGKPGEHGEFVSVPAASALLRLPLSPQCTDHAVRLVHETWGIFSQSRAATSRRVWWHHAGHFEELVCDFVDGEILMRPGPRLRAMMLAIRSEQTD